jgi:hypothetical protein
MPPLHLGVVLLAAWAVAALVAQWMQTRAFGRRRYRSEPAASAGRGVAYAFGPGMSPAAKESGREHPGVWLAGVAYHAGIAAAVAVLALCLLRINVARPSLRVVAIAGMIAGTALLLRRLRGRHLRALSGPDDYIANGLTTIVVALAAARTLSPAAEPAFLGAAMALLFYLPLGKIRHCVFFFAARYHSSVLFGRRGTFPPRH